MSALFSRYFTFLLRFAMLPGRGSAFASPLPRCFLLRGRIVLPPGESNHGLYLATAALCL